MPRCEGLPSGPCPRKVNDLNVKIGKGDLLLCAYCDGERRRLFVEATNGSGGAVAAKKHAAAAVAATSKADNGDSGDSNTSKLGMDNPQLSGKNVRNRSKRSAAVVATQDGLPVTASEVTASEVFTTVNELLMYAVYQRDKSTASNLCTVITSFYSANEISTAKRLLIQLFSTSLMDCERVTERRSSAQRSAGDAEADDIVEILSLLDNAGVLQTVQFVAAAYNRLPRYAPEDVNVCAIADRQILTDTTVAALAAKVDAFIGSDGIQLTESMNNAVIDIQSSLKVLNDKVTHLSVRPLQTATVPTSSTTNTYTSTAAPPPDRSCNLVLFGIGEDMNRDVWRERVQKALDVAAHRDISVRDMFRIGSYIAGKSRPVIVKLNSVWDKRIVLSGSWRLSKIDDMKGVYINADEPRDVRMRRTFDRLKARAVADNKLVSVQDGVLYADGLAVYSLLNGFVNTDASSSNLAAAPSVHDA